MGEDFLRVGSWLRECLLGVWLLLAVEGGDGFCTYYFISWRGVVSFKVVKGGGSFT
jgi:hypothetical protein